jgi:serine/threonine-protein phosphatase 2A regulatory subunit A
VLAALADSLKDMVDYIGGSQYIMSIVTPLEYLTSIEETTVRETAIESIKKILNGVKIKDHEPQIKIMLNKMMSSDWFTSKISCVCLSAPIYKNASPSLQLEILEYIILNSFLKKSATDEVPQVRKTVGSQLKELLNTCKVPEVEAISIFNSIKNDELDAVKMMAVDICMGLIKCYGFPKMGTTVLSFLKAAVEDKSWRIRYMVADKIVELCQLFDKDTVADFFAKCYMGFMQDSESEVRTITLSKLSEFCKYLDANSIIKKLIPLFNGIIGDQFVYVRKAFAENILQVSQYIGAQNTSDHLLPVILNVFKDASPEVKIAIIKGLDVINKVVGPKQLLQCIAPPIISLAQEKNWRIRMQTFEYFPMIAKQLGEQAFNEKFLVILLDGLDDSIFSIRELTMKNLKEISEVFGAKWYEKNALPKILSYSMHINYLYRMNVLFAAKIALPIFTTDIIEGKLVPIIAKMANDKIANVRFNVAKSIKTILPLIKDKSIEVLL